MNKNLFWLIALLFTLLVSYALINHPHEYPQVSVNLYKAVNTVEQESKIQNLKIKSADMPTFSLISTLFTDKKTSIS